MRYTINLTESEELMFEKYMKNNNLQYKAEAIRNLMVEGKINKLEQEQLDKISMIVKEELDHSLSINGKRIKSILYKGGKMASYSTYLLIGALRELMPSSKKKNVETLYEQASKFAMNDLKKKVE